MSPPRRLALCLLFERPVPLLRIAEACFRFTPKIAVRDPLHGDTTAGDDACRAGAIFLDVDAPASEAALVARVHALCARFKAGPRCAFGDDPGMALARARLTQASRSEPSYFVSRPTAIDELPLEALQDYSHPFAEDPDARKQVDSMIRMLRVVGLSSVGDFLKIPERDLASRFGREAILLAHRARSASQWVWPAFRPPERVYEAIDLQGSEMTGSCASMESLLLALRAPIDRCTARLRGRALRASRLSIRLKLDYLNAGEARSGQGRRRWEIALPVPQGSAAGILPLLRDRLDSELRREPLERPAIALLVEVTETTPGHGAQRDFFDAREREAEEWDALVGRLSQKLGETGAFVAQGVDRHFPEKAWVPVLQTSHGFTAMELSPNEAPPRPARILKNPELVRIAEGELLHPVKRKRWKIAEIHGPERLAAEWWDPQSRDRDYYRVTTETGQDLWIFTQVDQGRQVFLHGYFD